MLVCYCGYATVYLYRYIQFYSTIYSKWSFEENGRCVHLLQPLPVGFNVNKFYKLYWWLLLNLMLTNLIYMIIYIKLNDHIQAIKSFFTLTLCYDSWVLWRIFSLMTSHNKCKQLSFRLSDHLVISTRLTREFLVDKQFHAYMYVLVNCSF